MELVRTTKQQAWGWPGVANFVLGGMATGSYVISTLVAILGGVPQPAVLKFLAPLLAGLGFLALTIEAAWPLRAYHLVRHLRRSWMSRETLAGMLFIGSAGLDWLLGSSYPILWGTACLAALALMVSHGFIVYRVRSIETWNTPLIPVLFLTSGLAMGSGLLLLVEAIFRDPMARRIDWVIAGIACIVTDAVVWMLYLHRRQTGAFYAATRALRRTRQAVAITGIGHLLPILLLALVIAFGAHLPDGLWRIVAAVAGLATLAGGAGQKAGIVLKAGYLGVVRLGPHRDVRSAPLSSPPVR